MPKAPRNAKPAIAKTGARAPVLVDLALQGGGSHGAFTWGVLDRLLEEPWLDIEAVSGTSAGAMNAAVMASAFAKGGAPAARCARRDGARRHCSWKSMVLPSAHGRRSISTGCWRRRDAPRRRRGHAGWALRSGANVSCVLITPI